MGVKRDLNLDFMPEPPHYEPIDVTKPTQNRILDCSTENLTTADNAETENEQLLDSVVVNTFEIENANDFTRAVVHLDQACSKGQMFADFVDLCNDLDFFREKLKELDDSRDMDSPKMRYRETLIFVRHFDKDPH
uniref:Uncharacterized protein n=1 Tax=Glossina austeni TaxID=7395 RepID=A0A1A9VH74_GLOAU